MHLLRVGPDGSGNLVSPQTSKLIVPVMLNGRSRLEVLMRLIEGVLLGVSATWAAWWLVRRPPRIANLLFASLTGLLVLLQALIESPRIHLAPTYVLALGLGTAALRAARSGSGGEWHHRWIRVAVAIPVVTLVALGAALPVLFPVFTFSTPSGPFAIGTVDRELPNGPKGRDLAIQFWIQPRPARATVG